MSNLLVPLIMAPVRRAKHAGNWAAILDPRDIIEFAEAEGNYPDQQIISSPNFRIGFSLQPGRTVVRAGENTPTPIV